MAAATGHVWVASSDDSGAYVRPYDQAGGRLGSALPGLRGPLAAAGRTLWAGQGAAGLARIGEGGTPLTVFTRIPDAASVNGIVAGPRDVWIGLEPSPKQPNMIARIDAQSGRAIGQPIRLGSNPDFAFAVGGGAVWVTYPQAGVVAQIDPRPVAGARRSAARTG